MRTVFLGTPEAAVPSLDALRSISDVAAVVTQPDRPRGRSRTPKPSPVKERAVELGIEVMQPETSQEIAPALESLGSLDVAVIVAYGMLIRPEALSYPAAGFVNVHFSLLPRWRGAAPVQRAIEARDERIGVTLMQLDAGLDTGPTLSTVSSRLDPSDTAGEILDRLAGSGARLLAERLEDHRRGRIVAVPQDDERATHAPKVTPDERRLDLTTPPGDLVAKIHALSPAPGAHALHEGERFKILRAAVGEVVDEIGDVGALELHDDALIMQGSGRAVRLIEVQPSGKRAMSGTAWARGRQGSLGVLT